MEGLREKHGQLEREGSLTRSITDVQKTIDFLTKARNSLADGSANSTVTLAKLKVGLKQSNDDVKASLKTVHGAYAEYLKDLDKFKDKNQQLPGAENDALSSHPQLINRAITMHLLREGNFSVASTFIEEANAHPPKPEPTASTPNPSDREGPQHSDLNSEKLQQQFADMYHILRELRNQRNLAPAIQWAREHSGLLEARGSNLEFELCRMQFVSLYLRTDGQDTEMQDEGAMAGPLRALAYARSEFSGFQQRYTREIQQLTGALAFCPNLADSPYKRMFLNNSAWEDVASSFTREFCSLLGLSADSPLYIAATAGAIALPTLLKLQKIMKLKRTEWTTQNELPVEIPLPPSYHFHSIFVCPVSKEQGTDQNPPMMMPCGHVIAKDSLDKLSKGARFKCPYCPGESHPRDAKKVFL